MVLLFSVFKIATWHISKLGKIQKFLYFFTELSALLPKEMPHTKPESLSQKHWLRRVQLCHASSSHLQTSIRACSSNHLRRPWARFDRSRGGHDATSAFRRAAHSDDTYDASVITVTKAKVFLTVALTFDGLVSLYDKLLVKISSCPFCLRDERSSASRRD